MLLSGLLAWISPARAQTDEIQVYDAEITAPGHFNLTLHNNFTPSGRTRAAVPGGVVPDHALNGVPEFAYGVTEWFEAGVYAGIYTLTRDGGLLFDGAKLRALLVVPHARDRLIFYGVNFELGYNTAHWASRRYAGEIRPIVGVHLGRIDLIANPIVDTDFNGVGKLDFAPAARAAYHVSDTIAVALEHYADFGPVEHFLPHPDRSQTLYAVLDHGNGSKGIEFGIGRGLTRAADGIVVKLMWMHDF